MCCTFSLQPLLLSTSQEFINSMADALSCFNCQENFPAAGPECSTLSHRYSRVAPLHLDLSSLETQCRTFLTHGLASSTKKSYTSAQNKFISFCQKLGKLHSSGSPCPVDEWTLCLFATFLAHSLRHSSIKVYLLAARSLHNEQGFPDPYLISSGWFEAYKRVQGSVTSQRLPITDWVFRFSPFIKNQHLISPIIRALTLS